MQTLELFVSSALIALHAQAPKDTFRQRDVRFYTELFANWIESAGKFNTLSIHNNQIARELSRLMRKGTIKRRQQSLTPTYTLTSLGLVHCLQSLLSMDKSFEQQYVFFRIYFLSNYGQRIKALLQSAASAIPTGLKLEIDSLLDWRMIVKQALQQAESDKLRLEARIRDAVEMPKQVIELLQEKTWEETVSRIEQLYPYELNSMKSLSDLCANLPQELAKWELTEGSVRRAKQMWQPLLESLENYIQQLKSLDSFAG